MFTSDINNPSFVSGPAKTEHKLVLDSQNKEIDKTQIHTVMGKVVPSGQGTLR